ncbi:hypothetical protein HY218_01140 [Candidatus Saccharibacteria bacterium]|nr:hypothetical protein [Candidatus Saccharibacteria bacterium]
MTTLYDELITPQVEALLDNALSCSDTKLLRCLADTAFYHALFLGDTEDGDKVMNFFTTVDFGILQATSLDMVDNRGRL